MAARENQGYQIALVIFVMLTVLLSITTFMFFKKYREEQDAMAQVKQASDKATADTNAVSTELGHIKPLLGYTAETKWETIVKDYNADVALAAPYAKELIKETPVTVPEEDAAGGGNDGQPAAPTEITNPISYREIVKAMKAELDKRSADTVKLQDDKLKLEAQIAANRTEDKAKIDEHTKGQQTAEKDLADERAKFNTERDGFKADTAKLNEVGARKDNALTALEADLNAKIKDLTGQLAAVEKKRSEMRQVIVASRPRESDRTDGRITAVLAAEHEVYINLGSADGLRPQVTFSVYAHDAARIDAATSKGKIEVTQVTGPHMAIARILEESRADLILSGDGIFSPAFQPGRRTRFAIIGTTEIGRTTLRNLIAVNGGIIDAEVDENGKSTGKVTSATNYLIQGTAPTDSKAMTAFTDMSRAAEDAGTKIVNVQQFLDSMGYKADERSVALGKGADPKDFSPQKSGSAYDKPGKPFRERRPPTQISPPSSEKPVELPKDLDSPSAAKQPPAAKQPAAEKPAAEKPAAEKPAAEQPADAPEEK